MLSISPYLTPPANLSALAATPWQNTFDIVNISNSDAQLSFRAKEYRDDIKDSQSLPRSEKYLALDPYTVNRTNIWRTAIDSYFVIDKNDEYSAVSQSGGAHKKFISVVSGEKIPRFLVAAAANDVGLITSLLAKNQKIEIRDTHGRTALMYAAEFNSLDALNLLLRHKASPTVVCKQYKNALMYAVLQGNGDSVKRLLVTKNKKRAIRLVTSQDQQGMTALMMAAAKPYAAVVKMLLAAKSNPATRSLSGQTAAMLAAESGYTENLRALIKSSGVKAKALVTASDVSGKTVMAYALPLNDFLLNKLLWSSGVELPVIAYGEQNKNILMYALEHTSNDATNSVLKYANPTLIEQLLSHRDNDGRNALMHALINKKQPLIKRILRFLTADKYASLLEMKDDKRHTLLFYSITYSVPIKFINWQLMHRTERFNTETVFKKILLPAFRHAVAGNHIGAAEFLLKYNHEHYSTKLLAANTDPGITVLSIAAKRGRLEMVNYLLSQGAYEYPNARYVNKTAVMFAAENHHTRVVEQLNNYGTQLNNRSGRQHAD